MASVKQTISIQKNSLPKMVLESLLTTFRNDGRCPQYNKDNLSSSELASGNVDRNYSAPVDIRDEVDDYCVVSHPTKPIEKTGNTPWAGGGHPLPSTVSTERYPNSIEEWRSQLPTSCRAESLEAEGEKEEQQQQQQQTMRDYGADQDDKWVERGGGGGRTSSNSRSDLSLGAPGYVPVGWDTTSDDVAGVGGLFAEQSSHPDHYNARLVDFDLASWKSAASSKVAKDRK